MKLGKRDFRHGFFHYTITNQDRKWVGFSPPGRELTHTGRFVALIFGLTLAPAKF